MNPTCRLCGDEIEPEDQSLWADDLGLHHECAVEVQEHLEWLAHPVEVEERRQQMAYFDRVMGLHPQNVAWRDRARAAIAKDPERARGLLK